MPHAPIDPVACANPLPVDSRSFTVTRKPRRILLAGCAVTLLCASVLAPHPAAAWVCGGSGDGTGTQNGNGSTAAGDGAVSCGLYNTADGQSGVSYGHLGVASGYSSTSLGTENTASGDYSTAAGNFANASGASSTAVGEGPSATADYSTALGANSKASGLYSFAAGYSSKAGGTNNNAGTIAIGSSAEAGNGEAGRINAAAIGTGARANAGNASAFGSGAIASGTASSAFGRASAASGAWSTAVGGGSTASGDYSTAFGRAATASGGAALALGYGAQATQSHSIAIGYNSVADVANVVSVGASGAERRIVNIAPAVNGTDAVNLAQVQALIAAGSPRMAAAMPHAASKAGGKDAPTRDTVGTAGSGHDDSGTARGQRFASLGDTDTPHVAAGGRSVRTAQPVASLSCEYGGGKVTTAVGEQRSASSAFTLIEQSGVSFQQGGAGPGCVTLSFAAEVLATGAATMEVRAMLDGSTEASPGPVLFAQNVDAFNSRSFSFLFGNVAPGPHRVEIQFRNAREGGSVYVASRTTSVQFAR